MRLLRSGITGEKLQLPEGFSLEEALPILKKHSVISLAYQGAVNCGLDPKVPVMQKMLMFYYQILLTHEKQALALQELFAAFEENCIPYLPLKGYNLKKRYPKPEMRPMGDADILIHLEDYPRIQNMMQSLGFSLNHDTEHVYEWSRDVLHVELHKMLVGPDAMDFCNYYGTGWQLAQKSDGCRHVLSPEEEYVFLVVHLTKHYRSMGIGLRHFVDLYVYLQSSPELDMPLIFRRLAELGLEEFYRNIMYTLEVWFDGAEETPVTDLITEYVFASGNWGKLDTYYLTKAAKYSGSHPGQKLMLQSIFPDYKIMCQTYDKLIRWPVLLPVYWVIRWFEIILFRRRLIRAKVRILDDDAVRCRREALRIVGLTLDKV